MRYLGIDYGQKRIGIAISDPQGLIAFPRKVIFNRGQQKAGKELKRIVEDEGVSKIVVGMPIGLGGTDTEQTRLVRDFVAYLGQFINLPIEWENEILTTHLVEQYGVSKEHVDEAAAAVILQSYLDKQNKMTNE